MAAVDKPPGMLSHPLRAGDPSVLDAVRALGLTPAGGEDELRPGVANRLDKESSGVMLLALSEDSHRELLRAFKERRVEKSYLCLAHGKVRRMEWSCDKPIARDTRHRLLRKTDDSGRPALTRFRLMARYGEDFSLIEARPESGRPHQIRVHLREEGFSILGDHDYGVPHYKGLAACEVPRMMLHCRGLVLAHPVSGARLDLRSPLPDDFEKLQGLLAARR